MKKKEECFNMLLSKPIEDLEKLSVFSRSKTERVLANRLLRLLYKKLKPYRITFSKSDTYTFPEHTRLGETLAYSPYHAGFLALKEYVKPTHWRYFDFIDYLDAESISLESSYGNEDFTISEGLIIEAKETETA